MYLCSRKRTTVAATLLAMVCISVAPATTWYVYPDSSIQVALNSAAAGDTVLVAPGTYNENIVWPNQGGIKLLSEFGPEVTTIDGNDARVIQMAKYLSSTTVIDGFTIQHGSAHPPSLGGGGIYCDSASPTIRNNIFTSNSAYGSGGAIYAFHGSSEVKANVIAGNGATSGLGGGIFCGESSNVSVSENRISGNNAPQGGGIGCYDGEAGVQYNQVLSNTASLGGGLFFSESLWSGGLESDVHFNNIQGNVVYGVYADAGYDPAGPDSGDGIGGYGYIFEYPWLTQRIIFDLGADGILSPGDTVNPCSTYRPTIQVRNRSNLDYSATYFGATCWIGSYASYVRVDHPLARESTVAVVHYAIDEVPASDTIRKHIYARQVGIADRPADVPRGFALRADRNPFSRSLLVQYEIPTAGRVALSVHDGAGRLVATLAEGVQQRGVHSLTWDATECAPGVYFLNLSTGLGHTRLKALLTQ
jgi:hypothetical protein